MFKFRKATEDERNEISRLQYGGRWVYSDADMSDENFALFFGKMKALFGEPDEISESWESMYDYTIVAEDEKENNFLLSVYHGAGGSSIATPTDYNNIDLAPYKQAEKELLADEPLKDQIMAMRKMSGTVQSIMNLYSRKHVLEGARIDVKMAELKKELEAAKKLPAVTGYDEEQKNYYSFLSSVESFMKDMQKARDKGAYSDADYNAMSEAYEYGLSVI